MTTVKKPVGVVDANGVLWKATSGPGKFTDTCADGKDIYATLASSAAKRLSSKAA